jgi:multidrug efflux system outer membrane protein
MKPAVLNLSLGALALLLAGCSLAPKYQRPTPAIPPTHRSVDAVPVAEGERLLADLGWQDLLLDNHLRELVQTALTQNYDVRIASARVLAARAALGITRADQFPTVDAYAQYSNLRLTQNGITPLPSGFPLERNLTETGLGLNWELDFWGRLRNATAAARNRLLATEESQALVRQTLVVDVARAYFELLELDVQLAYTRQSLTAREETLRLVTLRVERGIAAEIDLRQAEILVRTARLTIVDLERAIEQKENQINLLLGQNPGPVPRRSTLGDQMVRLELPAGVPSDVLERRPDIRRAERNLIAANAEVGVARAAFFPRIALTAQTGYESASLGQLIEQSSGTWVFGPLGNLPVFNAGRIRSGVRSAQARKEQAVYEYQQSVLFAFRDVADSLIAYRKLIEFRSEQAKLVESLRAATRVADLRYRNGVTSYLEYLDSERQLLDGELRLAQARRGELEAAVQVYRALGGGWR